MEREEWPAAYISAFLNDRLWLIQETGTLPRVLGEAGGLPSVRSVNKPKEGALPPRWHV